MRPPVRIPSTPPTIQCELLIRVHSLLRYRTTRAVRAERLLRDQKVSENPGDRGEYSRVE